MKKLELWLRAKVPISPPDKTQHDWVAYWLLMPVILFTIVSGHPKIGLVWLGLVNLGAMYWEKDQVKIDWRESVRDYLITFKASFPYLVILVYLITKDFV